MSQLKQRKCISVATFYNTESESTDVECDGSSDYENDDSTSVDSALEELLNYEYDKYLKRIEKRVNNNFLYDRNHAQEKENYTENEFDDVRATSNEGLNSSSVLEEYSQKIDSKNDNSNTKKTFSHSFKFWLKQKDGLKKEIRYNILNKELLSNYGKLDHVDENNNDEIVQINDIMLEKCFEIEEDLLCEEKHADLENECDDFDFKLEELDTFNEFQEGNTQEEENYTENDLDNLITVPDEDFGPSSSVFQGDVKKINPKRDTSNLKRTFSHSFRFWLKQKDGLKKEIKYNIVNKETDSNRIKLDLVDGNNQNNEENVTVNDIVLEKCVEVTEDLLCEEKHVDLQNECDDFDLGLEVLTLDNKFKEGK